MTSTARRLTVFHLTDVHGRVEREELRDLAALKVLLRPKGPTESGAGLVALEQVLSECRRARGDEPALLLYCGDFIGTEKVHDWVGRGRVTLEALEGLAASAGLEHCYAVVGNHELDCGLDQFLTLKRNAKRFRFIADNLELDGELLSSATVVDAAGIRVALVSATTERTGIDAGDTDKARVALNEPVESVGKALDHVRRERARGRLDVAIGLVHLLDKQDEQLLDLGGLDLLLGGHSHEFRWRDGDASSCAWAKAGCYAQVLGVVTLLVDGGSVSVVSEDSYLVPAMAERGASSPILARYEASMRAVEEERPELFEPVARLPGPIGNALRVRRRDEPIGRVVADMMLAAARQLSAEPVHFAFINGGNIRAGLTNGDGRVRPVDLHAVLPYANELLIVEADRDVVRRVACNHIACAIEDPAGFLQVAGIRYRVGADGEFSDVLVEEADGDGPARWRPPEELDTIRLATIDYLVRAEGGHHFGFLGEYTVVETGVELVDAWLDHLKRHAAGGELAEIIAPPARRVELDKAFGTVPPAAVLAGLDRDLGDTLAWFRQKLTGG